MKLNELLLQYKRQDQKHNIWVYDGNRYLFSDYIYNDCIFDTIYSSDEVLNVRYNQEHIVITLGIKK